MVSGIGKDMQILAFDTPGTFSVEDNLGIDKN
jgi:hypothetical protein